VFNCFVSYNYRTFDNTNDTDMATVNYLYRSIKDESFLNLRLLFTHKDQNFQIGGKTKFKVSKDYWKNTHHKKRINDPELSNQRNELNEKLTDLSKFILDRFNSSNPDNVDKKWLTSTIQDYYDPDRNKPIPTNLIDFFDYYLEKKKKDLSGSRIKKINVIKHKLERFEIATDQTLEVSDIDTDFKEEFINYSEAENYSQNTQRDNMKVIKTICFYAREKGLKTDGSLDGLSIKSEEVESVYLNPEELEKIESQHFQDDNLENAKDWLLISCYTGQRISDFIRFNVDMIRIENGKYFLDFKQKKTKKLMTIPFVKEARQIVEKRNGNFPKKMSDQKYNQYIKTVCRRAGIKKEVKGKITKCITDSPEEATKNDFRRISGTYPKWKLITSHVGRRSFATNNYGKVPTTYLKYITGHSTEKMFLNYIKKSNKDLAEDAYNYFE